MRQIIGLRPTCSPRPSLHSSPPSLLPDQTAAGEVGESRLRDRDHVAADGAGTITNCRRRQLRIVQRLVVALSVNNSNRSAQAAQLDGSQQAAVSADQLCLEPDRSAPALARQLLLPLR